MDVFDLVFLPHFSFLKKFANIYVVSLLLLNHSVVMGMM